MAIDLATTFIVVRYYKRKKRVLAISEDEGEARKVYDAESTKLRDGDVGLYEVQVTRTLGVISGGYNRTRW